MGLHSTTQIDIWRGRLLFSCVRSLVHTILACNGVLGCRSGFTLWDITSGPQLRSSPQRRFAGAPGWRSPLCGCTLDLNRPVTTPGFDGGPTASITSDQCQMHLLERLVLCSPITRLLHHSPSECFRGCTRRPRAHLHTTACPAKCRRVSPGSATHGRRRERAERTDCADHEML